MRNQVALCLFAAVTLFLQGGEAVPKTPGVCFRFDDNKPPEQWKQMGELFEKYGYRMSLALVSQDLNRKESLEVLRNLSAKGHSMMDHLPNHAVYQIRARTPQEFEKYSKLSFADHADPKKSRVYFKYELNWYHPRNKKFQASIRSGELCGYPESMNRELGSTRKLLEPSSGTVYGIRIRNGKKMLMDFWGEQIRIPDQEKREFILLAANAAIQPSDDLLRFLASVSRANFLAAGLPAPRAWIQPGGWECFVSGEKISGIYGREFGYRSADCIPGSSRQNCLFHDPAADLQRFRMRPDFTGLDNGQDLPAMKRRIAEAVAKRQVKIFISHMWVNRVKGGWDAYLKGYEELLQWLKKHRIPVRTQEEWAEILYESKPEAEGRNIMPSLSTDLDEDGTPDGYELQKGCRADVKSGIVSIPRGGRLHLSDLGGLEKGKNRFALTVNGKEGQIVELDFFFVVRSGKNYRERRQFPLKNEGRQVLSGELLIKSEAVALRYSVSFSGSGSLLEVQNPVLHSVMP